jgi:hypothetical protein
MAVHPSKPESSTAANTTAVAAPNRLEQMAEEIYRRFNAFHCLMACAACEENKAFILAALRRAAERQTCEWRFDDDWDSPKWETACGQAFVFINGGPEENHARFCHYCGGSIVAALPSPPSSDTETQA